MKMTSEMETTSKMKIKKLPEILFDDSHTTTDVKSEMIPGVQTGNGIPYDKYIIRGIVQIHSKNLPEPPDTFQASFRHPLDTLQKPFRHPQDTKQISAT